MSRLIIILAGGVIAFLLYRWLRTEYKKKGRPFAIKATLVAAAIILIALAAMGRVHWLGAIAASTLAALRFALPVLFKALPFLQFINKARAQHHTETPKNSNQQSISEEEALKILGLEKGANKEDVIAAHRRLIQKVHPDRGGSEFLASQLNLAKEILLKKLQGN